MRLLLAKARPDWARWQAELSAHAEVMLRDPWRLTVLPETAEIRTMWLNLDEYQGVISVSLTAAAQLIAALDRYWPQPPVGVQWLCNGPATAEVLSQGGLFPQFPASGNTAEDVLDLMPAREVTSQAWLVVKGVGGRDVYPQVLGSRGASVHTAVVYERALDYDELDAMARLSVRADAILISSQMLGEALWARSDGLWKAWPGIWIMTSTRLLRWAKEQGIVNCRLASGASAQAVRQSIVGET